MRKGREEHKKLMERKKELLSIYAKETEYFNLLLEDKEWGIISQIDAIDIIDVENFVENHDIDYQIVPPEKETENLLGIIIEIKTGKPNKSVENHHKGQVVLQALVTERKLPVKIIGGKIIFTEDRSEISFPISASDKTWILEQVKNIYTMINTEIIPNPTSHEGKCTDCEYWPECKRS